MIGESGKKYKIGSISVPSCELSATSFKYINTPLHPGLTTPYGRDCTTEMDAQIKSSAAECANGTGQNQYFSIDGCTNTFVKGGVRIRQGKETSEGEIKSSKEEFVDWCHLLCVTKPSVLK